MSGHREGTGGRKAMPSSYEPPVVTVLGTIADLTMGAANPVTDITTTGSQ